MLKQDLDAEERAEVPFLLVKLQKEHKFEGKVPSLEEVHQELLNVLTVEENKKSDFPLQISRQLIEAQTKTGVISVGKEILEKVKHYLYLYESSIHMNRFKQII